MKGSSDDRSGFGGLLRCKHWWMSGKDEDTKASDRLDFQPLLPCCHEIRHASTSNSRTDGLAAMRQWIL